MWHDKSVSNYLLMAQNGANAKLGLATVRLREAPPLTSTKKSFLYRHGFGLSTKTGTFSAHTRGSLPLSKIQRYVNFHPNWGLTDTHLLLIWILNVCLPRKPHLLTSLAIMKCAIYLKAPFHSSLCLYKRAIVNEQVKVGIFLGAQVARRKASTTGPLNLCKWRQNTRESRV